MFESTLRFAKPPEITSVVSAMKIYTTLKKISTKTIYYEIGSNARALDGARGRAHHGGCRAVRCSLILVSLGVGTERHDLWL